MKFWVKCGGSLTKDLLNIKSIQTLPKSWKCDLIGKRQCYHF